MMKMKKKISQTLLYLVLCVYTFVSLYPLVWLVFYSLKDNKEIFVSNPFGLPKVYRWGNYVKALNSFDLAQYFINSIIVSSVAVICVSILAVMFSYATARMNLKHEKALRMYILSGMFIPANIILIPLSVLMSKLHLFNTLSSVIITYVAFGLSFATVIFYGFLRSIPFELEESAFLDGASIYTAFFRIILPLVMPAIATVAIFNFLSNWNEFNIAMVLLVDNKLRTLPLGLMYFVGKYQTDWGTMGASMIIASLPCIIIYLLISEKIEGAMTVGASVKG